MVHEKFLKVKGKVYGPYYYESYRDHGKVKKRYIRATENHGEVLAPIVHKGRRVNSLFYLVPVIFVLGILASIGLYYSQDNVYLSPSLSERLSLELNPYNLGESLSGSLKINLQKGELLPTGSKIIITQDNNSKEILLSDLVSSNSEGNFYLDGVELIGNGSGYGVVGEKVSYPDVHFTLLLTEAENETSSENPTEPNVDENQTETSATENQTEATPEQPAETSTSEETSVTESPTEENTEEDLTEIVEETSPEAIEPQLSPQENFVYGIVSKNSPFVYSLSGETAEIESGSVYIDSKNLTDSVLSIENSETEVIVTTDYSETSEGFGSDYLNGEETSLSIDLSELGIISSQGSIVISLVYENLSLAEVQDNIEGLVNETLNFTANLSVLKEIGEIVLNKNSSYVLDLKEYFAGAESYSVSSVDNISFVISEDNLTITTEENFTGVRFSEIFAFSGDLFVSQNFSLLVSNETATIVTKQYKAVINKPVKWVKVINLENLSSENLTIELPKDAENIVITTGQDAVDQALNDAENSKPMSSSERKDIVSGGITGNVVSETGGRGFFTRLFSWLGISGRVVQEDNSGSITETSNSTLVQVDEISNPDNETTVAIEYYTEAPIANESITPEGKKIIVSARDELNYTEILAYTFVEEKFFMNETGEIQLYWRANYEDALNYGFIIPQSLDGLNENLTVPVAVNYTPYDFDSDGNVDYIEWIVPHLSDQVYELVLTRGSVFSDVENSAVDGNYAHLKLNKEGGTYSYMYNLGVDDQYIELADPGLQNFSFWDKKTVSVWIKPAKPIGRSTTTILGDTDYWSGTYYSGLYIDGTAIDSEGYARIQAGMRQPVRLANEMRGAGVGIYADVMKPDEWVNVVGVFDKSLGVTSVYINGNLSANTTRIDAVADSALYRQSLTSYTSDPNLILDTNRTNIYPRLFDASSYAYIGGIDDTMIYNTSLTAAEIKQIYNYNRGYNNQTDVPKKQNLAGWWDFDEGTAVSIRNKITNNLSAHLGVGFRWVTEFNIGDRIVAYYSFDGDDSTSYDYSDHGLDGSYFGQSNSILSSNCKYEKCFNSSGSGYIQIPPNSFMNNMTDFSYSFWTRLGSNSVTNYTLLSKGRDYRWIGLVKNGSSYDLSLFFNGVNQDVNFSCYSFINAFLNRNVIVTGEYSQNGLNVSAYLDGQIKCSQLVAINGLLDDSSYNFTIGGYGGLGDFNGVIDDLMIFNKSLTAKEASLIKNESIRRFSEQGIQYLQHFSITPGNESVKVNITGVKTTGSSGINSTVYQWSENQSYDTADLGEDPYLYIAKNNPLWLSSKINLTAGKSVSFWIKRDLQQIDPSRADNFFCEWSYGYACWQRSYRMPVTNILGNKVGSDRLSMYFRLYYDREYYYMTTQSVSSEFSQNTFPNYLGDWYFYTLVFTSNGNLAYKNSNFIGIFGPGNLSFDQIGLSGSSTDPYNGSIDELTVFDKELTPSDVAGLYDLKRKPTRDYLNKLRVVNLFSFDNSFYDEVGGIQGSLKSPTIQDTRLIYQNNNLLAYYSADRTPNNLINDPTLNAAFNKSASYSNGTFGSAFNTSNLNYLTINDAQKLGFTDKSFSISFFFNSSEVDRLQTLLDKSVSEDLSLSNYRFDLDQDNHLLFYYTNGNISLSDTIVKDRWYHVLLSYNYSNREFKFYLDGALKNTSTFQVSPSSYDYPIVVGANINSQYSFNGLIDDLTFFGRELDDDQARQIFVKGTALWKPSYNFSSNNQDTPVPIDPTANNLLPVVLLKSDANRFFTPLIDLSGNSAPSTFSVGDRIPPKLEYVSPTPMNLQTIGLPYQIVNVSSSDANSHFVFSDLDNQTLSWLSGENLSVLDSLNRTTGNIDSGIELVLGKFGNAFNFSLGEYINVSNLSLGKTQSFWIKDLGGEWKHVVNNSGTIYVNGTIGSASTPFSVSGNDLKIGNVNAGLDELIFFNRTLNLSEIRSLYSAELNQYFVNLSNLGNGVHSFKIYSEDMNGNANNLSRVFSVNTAYPGIDFVSPTSGRYTKLTARVNASINDSSSTMSFLDYESSLVGWWDMDNVQYVNGKMRLVDSIGGNNCTLVRSAEPTPVGKFGSAMRFIEVSASRFDCGSSSSLRPANITVSFWIRNEEVLNTPYMWSPISMQQSVFGVDYTSYRIYVFGDNYGTTDYTGLVYAYAGNSSNIVNCINCPGTRIAKEKDTWYHIVWTYSQYSATTGYSQTYINGTLFNSEYTPLTTLYRGPYGVFSITGHRQLLDEVMIFNRSLNSQEVRALYGATNNLDYTKTGLVSGESFSYEVFAKNAAGNLNRSGIKNITIDKINPTVSIDSPNATRDSGSLVDINVSVQDLSYEANGSCYYSLDNANWIRMNQTSIPILTRSTYNSRINFSFSDVLAHRVHTLNVSCNDSAGNIVMQNMSFNVKLFDLNFSISAPSQINTTNTLAISGQINRTNGSAIWPLDNNMFLIKLNNTVISSGNISGNLNGNLSNTNISASSLFLNLSSSGSNNVSVEDYGSPGPGVGVNNLVSMNNIGYTTGYVFNIQMSQGSGDLTYKYSSPTRFSSFVVNMTTAIPISLLFGGKTCLNTSTNGVTWVERGCLYSNDSRQYSIAPNSKDFYVKLWAVKNSSGSVPVTQYKVNYTHFEYAPSGYYDSNEIRITGARFSELKWDENLNEGDVKIQLRDKNKTNIANSTVQIAFPSEEKTNVVATSTISPPLPSDLTNSSYFYNSSSGYYRIVSRLSSTQFVLNQSVSAIEQGTEAFQIINESWNPWTNNYTDNYGSNIFSALRQDTIQYRVNLLRGSDVYSSPNMSAVSIGYVNSTTNVNGSFSNNIVIPVSTTLGPNNLNIDVLESPFGVNGTGTRSINVYANTYLTYTKNVSYAGDKTNYSVGVYLNRTDNNQAGTGNLRVRLYDLSGQDYTQQCNSRSYCFFSWQVSNEGETNILPFGNYTLNVSTFNSNYYRDAPVVSYTDYLEEVNTTGSLLVEDTSIDDYVWGSEKSQIINVTVNNTGRASMYNISVGTYIPNIRITRINQTNSCGRLYPSESCNISMNVTVLISSIIPISVNWIANWTNNNGQISEGDCPETMYGGKCIYDPATINIVSASVLGANTTSINTSIGHGNLGIFYVNLSSDGSLAVTAIAAEVEEGGEIDGWVSVSPESIGTLSIGDSANLQINVSVPAYTPAGSYSGIVKVASNSRDGDILIRLNVTVPLNMTWTIGPENYTYLREFGLNTENEIGNITINNTGNADVNFTLNYFVSYDGQDLGDIYFETTHYFMSYNNLVNGLIANPRSVLVIKGQERVVSLYTNSLMNGYLNVGVMAVIANDTANPSSLSYQDNFSIVEQPPVIDKVFFYEGNQLLDNPELNREFKLKLVARDDNNLGNDPAFINLTLNGEVVYNGSLQMISSESPLNSFGGYLAVNYSRLFTLNTSGTYNLTVRVNDSEGNTAESSTLLTPNATTNLALSLNSPSVVAVGGIDKYDGEIVEASFRINNSGGAYAYSPALDFTPSSYSTINWNYSSFNNISSEEIVNKLLSINVSKLTPPGDYSIRAKARWKNPNGATDFSEGYTELNLSVSETKSLEAESSIYYVMDSFSNEVLLEVNNSGNVGLEDISLECVSSITPNFCETFSVGFNQSGFDIGVNRGIISEIELFTSGDLSQGEYSGTILISNQEVSKEVVLTVSIPQIWTWSSTPQSVSSVKGVGQTGFLQNISITNTGNQELDFNIQSSNSSVIIPSVDSILVPASSSRTFSLNFNVQEEKVFNENITLSNSSANPSIKVIPISLTSTNVKVNVISPNESSPLLGVIFEDQVQIETNASYEGLEITENSSWEVFIGNGRCKNETYNYYSGKWIINCIAPNIADGKYHDITAILDYNSGMYGRIEGTSSDSLFYKDLTSPYFLSIERNNIDKSEYINLEGVVGDNVGVIAVIANILYPDGNTSDCIMVSGNPWVCDNMIMDMAGEYLVNYTAYDAELNNVTTSGWFEVYEEYDWNLRILDYNSQPVRNMTVTLYRPGESYVLANKSVNSSGYLNMQVNQRVYDLSAMILGDGFVVRSADFRNSSNLIGLNLYRMNKTEVDSLMPIGAESSIPYTGIVVNQSGLENNSVEFTFDYSAYESTLPRDVGSLKIMKCGDWNYTGRLCIGNAWEELASNVTRSLKRVVGNSTGFSAYFLAMDSCGDGSCDAVYGESLLTCALDCTPSTPGNGGSGGAGGAGGGGGGGAVPKLNQTDLNKLLSGIITVGGAKLETTSINKELFAGETTTVKLRISNTLGTVNILNLASEGVTSQFISFENGKITLQPNEAKEILIRITVPSTINGGIYEGSLVFSSANESGEVPVSIKVLSLEDKLLDIKINLLKNVVAPGNPLGVQFDMVNLGKTSKVGVLVEFQIMDLGSGEVIANSEETFTMDKRYTSIKNIDIPESAGVGEYMVKALAYDSGVDKNTTLPSTSIAYFSVDYPILTKKILGLQLWVYLILIFLGGGGVGTYYYMQYKNFKNKRFKSKVDLSKLPKAGSNSVFVGKVAETGTKAFVDLNKLQMHTLIAGMTGSGKTVAAQDIVEAALLHNKSVILFDPTAQWTGFLRKCEDSGLLKRYKYFDMKPEDARAFNGNIKTINDPYEIINLQNYINRPGEITIFNTSNLDPKEMDIIVASTIEQIFKSHPEESKELKTLIVYDEVHRLLPKFGGSGQGFVQLERGAREFRKWGIGLVLISQVMSDFVGEIKANIGTEVQMGTRYEGDLERVSMKYGDDVLKSVVKEPIGTGMVVNAEYNSGRPYFVAFRPMLHSTKRLSNDDLKKYEAYFDIIEDMEYQVEELKKLKIDVLDIELEMKLTRNKVKEGQFQMADMYMESLKPLVEAAWKKAGKKPMHKVKELLAKEDVAAGIKKAKEEREKYIKKNPQQEVSLTEEVSKIKGLIEEKKRVGKKTSGIEIKLQDFVNRMKSVKKLGPDEAVAVRQEIDSMKKEVEKI